MGAKRRRELLHTTTIIDASTRHKQQKEIFIALRISVAAYLCRMAVKPKYRSLTTDELNELEQEFVEFLVVNGITADQWVEIKTERPEDAEDMITLFSDVVMEGVLRKVQFLEFRSAKDIKTFQCLGDKIVMVGMRSADDQANFMDAGFLKKAIQTPPKDTQVYTSEKAYKRDRQQELFAMIQEGCQIADGALFKALALALA